MRTPVALTVAGSDSGGGAGIQADLKTFAALGVHGVCAITALTAQNTLGVRAVHLAPPDMIAAQIAAVAEDFVVGAVKIGMLGGATGAAAVAQAILEHRLAPVVYDPVMAASSGHALAGAGFLEAVRSELLPLVDVLTPNLAEAAALLGVPAASDEAGMERQGRALLALGPRAVLMKGGHLEGDAVDLLVTAKATHRLAEPRIEARNLHGTGCTLSSALAARLVLGDGLVEAAGAAKSFVRKAIERGDDVQFGEGPGPLLPLPLACRA